MKATPNKRISDFLSADFPKVFIKIESLPTNQRILSKQYIQRYLKASLKIQSDIDESDMLEIIDDVIRGDIWRK